MSSCFGNTVGVIDPHCPDTSTPLDVLQKVGDGDSIQCDEDELFLKHRHPSQIHSALLQVTPCAPVSRTAAHRNGIY